METLNSPTYDYSLLDKDPSANILIVDDDILSTSFIESQITDMGHSVIKAENGQQALILMGEHGEDIDIVLMDREMPIMDGITTVRKMKEMPELEDLPVVMVTGADGLNEMREGLEVGVFHYLVKPVEEEMLQSVLTAAMRKSKQSKTLASELSQHRTSFQLIQNCKFQFKTLDEAEGLSAFIANCFPDPMRVLSGLGELLVNAVEHGNLGIGYERKGELIDAGIWRAEIEQLQALPENQSKFVEVAISHKNEGTYVVIVDQGEGFDWRRYMQIDPGRAGDNHGRGIVQAKTISFDKLSFNQKGNKVVAFLSKEKKLSW